MLINNSLQWIIYKQKIKLSSKINHDEGTLNTPLLHYLNNNLARWFFCGGKFSTILVLKFSISPRTSKCKLHMVNAFRRLWPMVLQMTALIRFRVLNILSGSAVLTVVVRTICRTFQKVSVGKFQRTCLSIPISRKKEKKFAHRFERP